MKSPANGLKLGATLYAFTHAWHRRELDLDGMLAKVAALDLGPGLEVIGFQSFRDFPRVSDDTAARFRDLVAKHGLTPSCLGINADMNLKPGQPMSVDEAVAYHIPQIESAAKLGFPIVRCQFAAPAEVLIKLLPTAEKYGIKMGPEIHAPLSPQSPPVMAYREAYAKAKSPLLGFVPDFGACAKAVPASFIADLREQGVPDSLVDTALEVWPLRMDPGSKRAEFNKRIAAMNADPVHVSAVSVMFNVLSPGDASMWDDIMPQVIHIHGKFYDFDASGNESAIPYDELLPRFQRAGYQGFMSSEWEGHIYSPDDGFDMVVKHQKLAQRILDNVSMEKAQ